MNILVTNDDGFSASGLRALFAAAGQLGRPIAISSPDSQSMKSHGVTTDAPISIEKRQDPLMGTCYVCEATPADCVRLGLKHLPIPQVDLVLSGINHGGNAGVDVFYSGTVAAAREAAIMGVRAIAVSQLIRPSWTDNWQHSTEHALHAIRTVLNQKDPGSLININLPDFSENGSVNGIQFCSLAPGHLPVVYESDDVKITRYRGKYFDRPAPEGSDFYFLKQNWVTITPLVVDATDFQTLSRMSVS